MAYLFTPPTVTITSQIEGSLRFSYQTCETVWKDQSGVWHHQQTPDDADLTAASVALQGTPQVVTDALANELITAGIGTCTPIGV